MDRTRTTRRLRRRTCSYTKTLGQHRTRVSEGEHPDTFQEDVPVRRLRSKTREDGAGPSSSVDVHRGKLISSAEDVSKGKKRRPDLDLTETKDKTKLCTAQKLPAHVQKARSSTSELSSAPAIYRTRTTRRLQRRASPYSLGQHRTRVSEGEHPDTSQKDLRVRLLEWKAREDGAGPSSSVDVHRENLISSAEDVSKGRKRRPDLDLTEMKDESELCTANILPAHVQKAAFEAKYKQQKKLGVGGCASVFAGYRKADHLPVAIKRVPSDKQCIKHVEKNGKTLPMEVAIMLKLVAKTSGSAASSAPVSLLDWYDLEQELILVLERPDPCVDLAMYMFSKGGLQEKEAKIILKQLVDALIELQDKHIFHRDIKVENILIETGLDFPRVRIIDFGLSCFVKKGASYQHFYGTPSHAPPEMYNCQRYRAGPTTVWQMGVVLFEALHKNTSFETLKYFKNGLTFSKMLSKDCKDFLQMCLTEDPKQRQTLEQLKHHPWLGLTNNDHTSPRHTILKSSKF
ncbi:serine/threonine-protein kinase pim-1-like isoform X2 [Sebastes umbrosus]|uniref:serine/threonine-protein kinase pim-1-like isoform X2 n=1 Tax=Sebastes umbrosus TaxID=72105 RepID=UPI00189F8DD9|nr:serine/threonine-protein kinase pim-1-like isoform X2 [Sebastes umbrosus]